MLKDVISQIQEVNMKKKQLEKQFQELSKPALADYGFIPQLYEWFCEALADIPPSGKTQRRREFIFIVLYLYEPKSLLGIKRMPCGLRGEICEIFDDISLCRISDDSGYAYSSYMNYKDFRNEVNTAFSYIAAQLRNK